MPSNLPKVKKEEGEDIEDEKFQKKKNSGTRTVKKEPLVITKKEEEEEEPEKKNKKRKREEKKKKVKNLKVAASRQKDEISKKEKKVYELPGQRHDPPEMRDPLRIFYETLYEKVPTSEMAAFWMMEWGLLPAGEARKVYEKKLLKSQNQKLNSPSKPKVISVKKSTTIKAKKTSIATSKTIVKTSKERKKVSDSDADDDGDDDSDFISKKAGNRRKLSSK
ncbi:hypothetical protein HPP92_003121 [Vanilla planifolia]|uniref:Uncharacterized protein n=1 Tax=Vanilla planifolia TaxID=51239 RepID=A0A835VJK9_VANPL|nr:hypothetical protein HPP92_003121 [Vanilla planifolia]